jgi:hypothetical protein
MLHEVCCRQAHFCTVEQHRNVWHLRLVISSLPIVLGGILAGPMAIQAVLNALLNLHLAH